MTIVQLIERALEDMAAIADFYDLIEWGVGQYFFEQMNAEISRMLPGFAGTHRVRHGFFYFNTRRFPMGVYYLIDKDGSVIVDAVLDQRRRPISLASELRNRRKT
jgi:hypothetical protein